MKQKSVGIIVAVIILLFLIQDSPGYAYPTLSSIKAPSQDNQSSSDPLLQENLPGSEWRCIQEQILSNISQQAYLKASNTNAGDLFGSSVAISGDTIVIGAIWESSAALGVNGNQSDNNAEGAGAAYVFVRSGSTWTQQAYLKASNTNSYDFFGSSVAISGDTIVVGAGWESSAATGVNGNQSDNSAYGAGAAYVFVRSGSTWTQQAYLKASNTNADDYFGSSVSISGDTIVIGARGEDSSAAGVNGNQSDNNAPSPGAAYVFVRSGSTWTQQTYLKASYINMLDWFDDYDEFGGSVAVSGDTILIGARGEDSNATGVNGNQSNTNAHGSGAAYVFVRNGSTWTQQAYLKASNTNAGDDFGGSVAISRDTILIGARGEDSNATGVNGNQYDNNAGGAGAAYIFGRSGSTWTQQAYLKASNTNAGDEFGLSIAISGDTIVIGAPDESSAATGVNGNQSDNNALWAGAAYFFVRSGSTWTQQAYLKASNTNEHDDFGSSAAIYDGMYVICASNESSAATGVNGDQNNNNAESSGAAYVFTTPSLFNYQFFLPTMAK